MNSAGTTLDYGTLPVAGGGTGVATLSAGIVKASGTANFTTVAAPTGSIVGDSDTQNISNKTYINPFFDFTQDALAWRRSTAGNLGIEFGSGNASGGTVYWDFHVSNTDGDYSSRLVRNSGVQGTFDLIQNANSGFRVLRNTDLSTVGGTATTLFEVSNTIQTTDASPQNYPTATFISQYSADDSSSPFSLGSTGLQTELRYGISPSDRAAGSALARSTTVKINGSGGSVPTSNEIAADMGWMKCIAGETCSLWYSDWSAHGPVAVQPGQLSGINMFLNNYYNGNPLRNGSYGLAIQTEPNNGGGNNAEHAAATTYKLGYGMMIAGYAGTVASPTRGYEIGLMIGGFDANWLISRSAASKIGTGIKLRDIESVGIDLNDPATSASSPIAIKVTTVTRTWDTFLDLSSGLAPTTAAIKLGGNLIQLGTTEKFYESGTNTVDLTATSNTQSMLRLAPNISTVSSTAIRGMLRVLNNTGANAEHLSITARGTAGFWIDANKDGSGTLRPIVFQVGGTNILTLDAGGALLTSNVAHAFDTYVDQKVITIPADPASGYVRVYPKAVDANNDGLFVKLKIAGTVTEVQLA